MDLSDDVEDTLPVDPNSEPTVVSMLEQSVIPTAYAANQSANLITDCDNAYWTLGSSNWQSRQLTIIDGMNTAYASTNVSHQVSQLNCNNFDLASTHIFDVADDLRRSG